jgi:hypothetical protein
VGLTTPHHKNKLVVKNLKKPRTWTDSLEKRPKRKKICISPSTIRMIKSRRMRWAGNVAQMGEKRDAHRILVGKPEGKRPLGRPRLWWVDNIKMYLREIEWKGMDWIGVGEDRDQWRALLNTVMNLRVP